MDDQWYYVEGDASVGPIATSELKNLIQNGTLGGQSFVWKKGFENWTKIAALPELAIQGNPQPSEDLAVLNFFQPALESFDQKCFYIKTGMEGNREVSQFGPYSLNVLIRLFKEQRVNGQTLIWKKGMDDWAFIGTLPFYAKVFGEKAPPAVFERRKSSRRPFVAKILFHDRKDLFEGICRDISLGGMQLLVPDLSLKEGDEVSLNVHPDNTNYHFVAKGKIVRVLEKKQGFSLKFIDLTDEAKSAIKEYLESGAE